MFSLPFQAVVASSSIPGVMNPPVIRGKVDIT